MPALFSILHLEVMSTSSLQDAAGCTVSAGYNIAADASRAEQPSTTSILPAQGISK